jgi:hypothetical protein
MTASKASVGGPFGFPAASLLCVGRGLTRLEGSGQQHRRSHLHVHAGCRADVLVYADAGVVAMMMPIGMSLYAYISQVWDINPGPGERSRLASFLALGTLYGSVAGGVGHVIYCGAESNRVYCVARPASGCPRPPQRTTESTFAAASGVPACGSCASYPQPSPPPRNDHV